MATSRESECASASSSSSKDFDSSSESDVTIMTSVTIVTSMTVQVDIYKGSHTPTHHALYERTISTRMRRR